MSTCSNLNLWMTAHALCACQTPREAKPWMPDSNNHLSLYIQVTSFNFYPAQFPYTEGRRLCVPMETTILCVTHKSDCDSWWNSIEREDFKTKKTEGLSVTSWPIIVGILTDGKWSETGRTIKTSQSIKTGQRPTKRKKTSRFCVLNPDILSLFIPPLKSAFIHSTVLRLCSLQSPCQSHPSLLPSPLFSHLSS